MRKETKNKIIGGVATATVTMISIGIALYKANKYIKSILPSEKDFDPFRNKRK